MNRTNCLAFFPAWSTQNQSANSNQYWLTKNQCTYVYIYIYFFICVHTSISARVKNVKQNPLNMGSLVEKHSHDLACIIGTPHSNWSPSSTPLFRRSLQIETNREIKPSETLRSNRLLQVLLEWIWVGSRRKRLSWPWWAMPDAMDLPWESLMISPGGAYPWARNRGSLWTHYNSTCYVVGKHATLQSTIQDYMTFTWLFQNIAYWFLWLWQDSQQKENIGKPLCLDIWHSKPG